MVCTDPLLRVKMSAELKLSTRGLSKSWKVQKSHTCCYTGGKAVLTKDENSIVCLRNGDVAVVDILTGQVSSSLQDGVDDVVKENFTTFAVHPSGHEIVTASNNCLLRHWVHDNSSPKEDGDNVKWECKRSFKSNHTLPIMCMDYDASGTLVATGSNDQSTRVWDVPHGYCTHSFKNQGGNISVVRFHPDGNRLQLFTGTDGNRSQKCIVRAFDLNTQKTVAEFEDHMSEVTAIVFSTDGWTMCTGSRDKVLNFYDTRRWKLLKTAPIYESVSGLANVPLDGLGPDARDKKYTMCVASGGTKGDVRIWGFREAGKATKRGGAAAAATCTLVGTSEPQQGHGNTSNGAKSSDDSDKGKAYGITALLCRRSKSQIVSITEEHFFHFWRSGDVPLKPMQKCKQIVGYNDEIIDLKFIPTSSGVPGEAPETKRSDRIVMAANSDQLRSFHLQTFDCELMYGHKDIVLACDVSPDGLWLASVSKDQTVRVWDLVSYKSSVCVALGVGHTEAIGAVCFGKRPSTYNHRSSHTSAWLFTGSKDKTLKSWDLGAIIRSRKNVDGSLTVSGGTSPIVIDTLEVRDNKRAHTKDINALAISPNDTLLASASQDKTIVIWNPHTLEDKGTLRGHKRGVWSVEFSPVDKTCVSAGGDRLVKLWSLSDYTCIKTFEGHMASVLRCYFLSNGMQVMSSGADGLVKLWTIKNNECTNSFDAHEDKVWALGVRSWVDSGDISSSRDAQPMEMHSQMVSGGGDSVMNVWEDCTIHEAEEEIKKREERIIKQQELANHVARKEYRRAIILCLELDFPFKLRGILEELLLGEAPNAKITLRGKSILKNKDTVDTEKGHQIVESIVAALSDTHILQWLKYVRQWNTSGRHSVLAQRCLAMVLKNFFPDHLMSLSPDVKKIFEGIVAYSDRHFKRINRLVKRSYLLDHTLASMDMLMAPAEEITEIDPISSDSDSSSSSESDSGDDEVGYGDVTANTGSSSSDSSSSNDEEEEEASRVSTAAKIRRAVREIPVRRSKRQKVVAKNR